MGCEVERNGGDGKVPFVHVFNVNLQYAEVPVDATPVLVEQGLVPLLDLLDRYGQPASFFFTGWSSLYLKEHYPHVVGRVRCAVSEGRIELGTYTFAHPVLSLLPYEDVERQIRMGVQCDGEVWDVRPRGMLLPEVAWDPCVPRVMRELGLEWVVIYRELIPALADASASPGLVRVRGVEGSQALAVLATRKVGKAVLEYLAGARPWEGVREAFHCLLDGNAAAPQGPSERGKLPLVCVKLDAEVLYVCSVRMGETQGVRWGDRVELARAQRLLERYLEFIATHPRLRPMTVGAYVRSCRGAETGLFYAESASGHAGFDVWLRGEGRERLNVLTDDARQRVVVASLLVRAARAAGRDVRRAEELLGEAWGQLLLAENSDGRAFAPHPSRKIFVADAACRAAQLAARAAESALAAGVGASGVLPKGEEVRT